MQVPKKERFWYFSILAFEEVSCSNFIRSIRNVRAIPVIDIPSQMNTNQGVTQA